jgi:hypothetical protein
MEHGGKPANALQLVVPQLALKQGQQVLHSSMANFTGLQQVAMACPAGGACTCVGVPGCETAEAKSRSEPAPLMRLRLRPARAKAPCKGQAATIELELQAAPAAHSLLTPTAARV